MAQHDYQLSDQSGMSFRQDLNAALAAILSQNSGATEPTTTGPFMLWVDTSVTPAVVRQRNAENDGWLALFAVGATMLAADDLSPLAQALLSATTEEARTALGLGTAATKAAGTGAGNVLLLAEANKLPALDASLLTNLPASGGITLGTAVSASGTAVDFTGIPANVKRVTVTFTGLSTNGTSGVLFQIGDAGGVETSGYVGVANNLSTTAAGVAYTAGIGIDSGAATNVFGGSLILSLHSPATNTWCAQGAFSRVGASIGTYTSGYKSLSAALDRIRVTTVNGTDQFDGGAINVSWEV